MLLSKCSLTWLDNLLNVLCVFSMIPQEVLKRLQTCRRVPRRLQKNPFPHKKSFLVTLDPWFPTPHPHTSLHTHFSSLLTRHSSLLTPHSSRLPPHSSLLAPHSSRITPSSSLLTPHSTPLTPHSSLLTPSFALLTPTTPHVTSAHPTSEWMGWSGRV